MWGRGREWVDGLACLWPIMAWWHRRWGSAVSMSAVQNELLASPSR